MPIDRDQRLGRQIHSLYDLEAAAADRRAVGMFHARPLPARWVENLSAAVVLRMIRRAQS